MSHGALIKEPWRESSICQSPRGSKASIRVLEFPLFVIFMLLVYVTQGYIYWTEKSKALYIFWVITGTYLYLFVSSFYCKKMNYIKTNSFTIWDNMRYYDHGSYLPCASNCISCTAQKSWPNLYSNLLYKWVTTTWTYSILNIFAMWLIKYMINILIK